MPQTRIITLLVRYGLPLIVLAFYLTAARRFAYTPDTTYAGAREARSVAEWGTYPSAQDQAARVSSSPLWVFFQAAGIRSSIEPLLFSKVFGLFFCCMGLVLVYLVANELLDDRLLAFCVSFVVAMQSWLLFLAPGGTAIPAASAVALASIFFMLRNEYILAGLFAGVASLLFWEGILLLLVVIVDLALNSVRGERNLRLGGITVLAYAAVVGAWLVYADRTGAPFLIVLQRPDRVPESGFLVGASYLLLGALAAWGVIQGMRGPERRILVRQYGALLTWTVVLLVWTAFDRWELLPLAMPLLVIWGFRGIQLSARAFGKDAAAYPIALGAVTLCLLLNQIEFNLHVKPEMVRVEETAFERDAIATWVKSNISDSLSVEADFPGELAYRTGRIVLAHSMNRTRQPDIVVCSGDSVPGYSPAYAMQPEGIDASPEKTITVWKKRP